MKNKLLILLFFLLNDFIYAQCAMCRAVLESSENEGMAEGINNGIDIRTKHTGTPNPSLGIDKAIAIPNGI